MTAGFCLPSNTVHPALIAALNDFDHTKEEARFQSLRGCMGDSAFFMHMFLSPLNFASLLIQLMLPNPLTPIVVGLNILALGTFGLQVALWRIRLPSFYDRDVLETAQAKLRALMLEMNSTAPSLQPIFQELETTLAHPNADMVWVMHVYTTLDKYDAVKHHTNHTTLLAYQDMVGGAVQTPSSSHKLKV